MKLLKKATFALFTVCVLALCTLLCAANVSAAEVLDSGECGDSLTWTLYDDGELVIEGTGDMWDWNATKAPWYSNRSNITSVTIKEGVTSIGNKAFVACEYITSIIISDGVITIGDYAIFGCKKLTNCNIPNSVTTIGYAAFSSCTSLTSITIPDGVTSIGQYAFAYCTSLTSVTIPNSVTFIDEWTFFSCTSLTSITVLSRDVEFGSSILSSTNADLTLYGYLGSTTEAYAAEYGLKFVALNEYDYIPGDINNDGSVDIGDSIALFRHSMLPNMYPINYPGSVDFNKDGFIDIADAILLFMHSMLPEQYPL